jgi:hypothetical protein
MNKKLCLLLGAIVSLTNATSLQAGYIFGDNGWIFHENTEKSIQEFLKSLGEDGIPNIKIDTDTIAQSINNVGITCNNVNATLNNANQTLNGLKASLDHTNKNFKEFSDTSLLNKKNADAFVRSCAFTAIGCFVSCCGVKLIYDSCQDITTKITAEENQDVPLREILSWRDFVRPTLGLTAVGIGYTIITHQ